MADSELDIDDLCDTITESVSADDRQTRWQYQAACAALSALRNECEKLRARVAELEQAHSEQVAEREHLEEAARLLRGPMLGTEEQANEFKRQLNAWLEAERARKARGAKREGSG